MSQDQVDARVSGVGHGEAQAWFLESRRFTLRRHRIQGDRQSAQGLDLGGGVEVIRVDARPFPDGVAQDPAGAGVAGLGLGQVSAWLGDRAISWPMGAAARGSSGSPGQWDRCLRLL